MLHPAVGMQEYSSVIRILSIIEAGSLQYCFDKRLKLQPEGKIAKRLWPKVDSFKMELTS